MKNKNGFYILVFLFIPLILYYPVFFKVGYLVGGFDILFYFEPYKSISSGISPKNHLLSDSVLQFFPWLKFARESIKNGIFPLWNPYQAMGVPFWANFQNSMLALNNIFFYITSFKTAIKLTFLFKLLFAFVGMFYLLLLIVKDKLLAFAGGCVFTFAGFNAIWLSSPISSTYSWFPWILWAIMRFLKKTNYKRFFYLTTFIALSYLAGHVETAFFNSVIAFLFSFLYVILKRHHIKKIFYIIGSFISAFFLTLFLFLPFIEYLLHSEAHALRSSLSGLSMFASVYPLLTLFSPTIFGSSFDYDYNYIYNFHEISGGYFTFILLIAIPFSFFHKNKQLTLSYVTILIISFFLSFKIKIVANIISHTPILKEASLGRFIAYIGFSGIILGTIGWNYIIKKKKILWAIVSFILFLIIFLLFSSHFVHENLSFAYKRWFIASIKQILLSYVTILAVFIAFFFYKPPSNLWKLLIILIVLFETLYTFKGINPILPSSYCYFRTETLQKIKEVQYVDKSRVALLMDIIPPNIATYFRIFELRNYDALELKRNIELINCYRDRGLLKTFRNVSSPFFNFLAVKYILTSYPSVDSETYPYLIESGYEKVKENTLLIQPFFNCRSNCQKLVLYINTFKPETLCKIEIKDNMKKTLFSKNIQNPKVKTVIDIPPKLLKKGKYYYLYVQFNKEVSIKTAHLRAGIKGYIKNGKKCNKAIYYGLIYDDKRYTFIYKTDKNIYWYKNNQALSHAFLTNYIKIIDDNPLFYIANTIVSKDYPEVFIEKNDLTDRELKTVKIMQKNDYYKEAKIDKYEPNKVKIKVIAEKPALLVLSDTYYPGWQVYVNGKRKHLLRVNYNFRGVFLNKGRYEITFKYKPLSFYIGLAVSFVTLIFLLLFFIKNKEKL